MKLIVVVLMSVLSAVAQNSGTPVVPVSPTDVAQIEQVYNDMQAAEKRWADLQKDIGQKYLVVEKDDRNAGDEKWYPGDTALTGTYYIGSSGIVSNSTTLTMRGDGSVGWSQPECETAEHKKDREAKESAAEAQRRKESEEREAKSKRIRRGFHSTDSFIFSDGWGYLLPKPPEPPPAQQDWRNWAVPAVNLSGKVDQ